MTKLRPNPPTPFPAREGVAEASGSPPLAGKGQGEGSGLLKPLTAQPPSLWGLALGAVILWLPWLLGLVPGVPVGYVLYLVCLGLVYAIVALGLNLLIGFAGQFSLGHAGFLAIGAYASAILTQTYGWPFLLALPMAGLLTAAVGFLLGLPALRLSGPYLALVTLGFGLSIPQLALWRGDLTGGAGGLRDLPYASFFGVELRTEQTYYYLVLAVIVGLTLFARNLVQSQTGRAFIAIRDSEIAAQAMGVNLLRYKTTVFAVSAFYAGIAGSLYAHLIRFISPESFTIFLSVEFLTMIVVGGLGSVPGSIVGALFLTALPEIFTRTPILKDFKNLFIVVFGAVLILTILFFPRGLAGAWQTRRRAVSQPAPQPPEVGGPEGQSGSHPPEIGGPGGRSDPHPPDFGGPGGPPARPQEVA